MNRDQENRHGSLARGALFVLLWFVASFYFFGDLGKWMDDWAFHARDPATGGVIWSKLLSLDPIHTRFWRPFHIHAAIALQTAFWRHDWATHLFLAVVHGINAWLLWKVLGRMCAGRRAPALGALLFLVYPAGHEAIYWNSTIGTGVGLWWLLACTLAVQKYASGEIGLWGWRGLLIRAPLLCTLAWWYEQAAACAPALAAAYLACVPVSKPIRRRLIEAGLIVGAAMVAGVVYAVLMVTTTPPSARGGTQTIIRPGELVPQVRLILSQAWSHFTLRNFIPGALSEGSRALRSRPVEALALGGGMLCAIFGFGSWWMRAKAPGPLSEEAGPGYEKANHQRRFWGIAYGAGIVAASMVPAIAVHEQWFASRLAYTPVLGLMVILAVGIDWLLAAPWAEAASAGGRFLRGAVLAALAPSLVLGSIMLIGVQSSWHTRAKLDRRAAAELRQVLPSPVPDAVFVPTQIRARPTNTGSGAFDAIGSGPFEFSWSAPCFVRFAYQRADLHALANHRWFAPGHQLRCVRGASEAGLLIEGGILPQLKLPNDAHGDKLIPWAGTVPFRLLKGGAIRLADSVRVEDEGDPSKDRVVWLAPGATAPGWSAVILPVPDPAHEAIRPEWKLVGPDGRSPVERRSPAEISAVGRAFAAYTLHPRVAPIPDRCELRAEVGPSDRERVLSMRVAMFDYTAGLSDGVTVSVEQARGAAPLVVETITHERLRQERRWVVVRAVLPASDAAREYRVVVGAGPANDPNADWCLVTPPVVSSLDQK